MKQIFNNTVFRIGIGLYLTIAILFLMTLQPFELINTRNNPSVFFSAFGAFWIYFISLLIDNKQRTGRIFKFSSLSHNILLLLIGNLSAYALNQEMSVFKVSTGWLTVFLFLLNIGMLYFSIFKNYATSKINYVLVALLSAGALFGFYQVLYMLPLSALSVMVFWFFGLSLHTFIPLFWMILLSIIVVRFIKKDQSFLISAIVGVAIPLVFVIVFTAKWSTINHQIQEIYRADAVPLQEQELPKWVRLSQQLDRGSITKKVLKSGAVYATSRKHRNWFWSDGGIGGGRFNERKKHDPMVMVASFFSSPLELKFDERKKILNAVFGMRHKTERKLWSGDKCETTNIVTNVQLFPEYRIAYTEKIIDIALDDRQQQRWQPRQQEALYSFYLPEGSVVTSASLWVEGIERESYLTTRNKADSAYTTIVGRERRDPLLLHWQEGNRVTVRVFPVTKKNPRKFKIGVTTPLKLENDELVYENIDFAGPYWKNAQEQINIVVDGELDDIDSHLNFKQTADYWTYAGNYKSDWRLRFAAPPLSKNTFSFNNKTYQLLPDARTIEVFSPTEIYLDINAAWTWKEFQSIFDQKGNQQMYVYQNKLLKLTDDNKERLFEDLQQYNYSLFPFHEIKNPASALVITKNNFPTPVLDDLKKTKFSNSLNEFMVKNETPVRVLNLGTEISAYLKTLKELRTISMISGDFSNFKTGTGNNNYYVLNENNQTIAMDAPQMRIQETTAPQTTESAPDHLLRLFTYNDLMKKIGRDYFKKEKLAETLVAQAEEGYVVSPVSSLIVLETQEDYDRFDIKRSKNSLKNASIKNSGSVPEPHEWMLIILCLLVGSFFWWKRV